MITYDDHGNVLRTSDECSSTVPWPNFQSHYWLQRRGGIYEVVHQRTLKPGSPNYLSYEKNREFIRRKKDLKKRIQTYPKTKFKYTFLFRIQNSEKKARKLQKESNQAPQRKGN